MEIKLEFNILRVQQLNPVCYYFTILNTFNMVLSNFYNSFTNAADKCKAMPGFGVVSFKMQYVLTWYSALVVKDNQSGF